MGRNNCKFFFFFCEGVWGGGGGGRTSEEKKSHTSVRQPRLSALGEAASKLFKGLSSNYCGLFSVSSCLLRASLRVPSPKESSASPQPAEASSGTTSKVINKDAVLLFNGTNETLPIVCSSIFFYFFLNVERVLNVLPALR